MAKLQRWKRRGGTAGEGTGDETGGLAPVEPDAQVEPVATPEVPHLEPEPAPEPAPAPAPETGRDSEPDPEPVPEWPDETRPSSARRLRQRVGRAAPVLLFLAAHPKQGVVTAAAVAFAAALTVRPTREVAVVFLTVLVGQTILGWHNDIVDRARDARHDAVRKPVSQGRLDPDTVWYAIAVGTLLVIPLSLTTGITAGFFYLAALVVGLSANVWLRRGRLSWVLWAASFALLPAYLSYGGWGGDATGSAPEPVMVVLAAMLGFGVHFLRAIWGLVADDADGWTYLPLRLGRKVGATRLLVISAAVTGVVLVLIAIAGSTVGLHR